MLGFEETNEQTMRANVEAPTGFVVIPVEEYNKLLIDAVVNKPPVKVYVEKYAKYPRIEAYVDHDWLHKYATAALREKFSEDELSKYNIRSADEYYGCSVTIAEATEEVKAAIDAAKAAELAPGAETL